MWRNDSIRFDSNRETNPMKGAKAINWFVSRLVFCGSWSRKKPETDNRRQNSSVGYNLSFIKQLCVDEHIERTRCHVNRWVNVIIAKGAINKCGKGADKIACSPRLIDVNNSMDGIALLASCLVASRRTKRRPSRMYDITIAWKSATIYHGWCRWIWEGTTKWREALGDFGCFGVFRRKKWDRCRSRSMYGWRKSLRTIDKRESKAMHRQIFFRNENQTLPRKSKAERALMRSGIAGFRCDVTRDWIGLILLFY